MTDKEMYLQLAAVCHEKYAALKREIEVYRERYKFCVEESYKWQQKEAEMLHRAEDMQE